MILKSYFWCHFKIVTNFVVFVLKKTPLDTLKKMYVLYADLESLLVSVFYFLVGVIARTKRTIGGGPFFHLFLWLCWWCFFFFGLVFLGYNCTPSCFCVYLLCSRSFFGGFVGDVFVFLVFWGVGFVAYN